MCEQKKESLTLKDSVRQVWEKLEMMDKRFDDIEEDQLRLETLCVSCYKKKRLAGERLCFVCLKEKRNRMLEEAEEEERLKLIKHQKGEQQ